MASSLISIAATLVAFTSAALAEPFEFHRQTFPDQVTVSMVLMSRVSASRQDYDYLVTISLIETDSDGAHKYSDRSLHKAGVKCGPVIGKVMVGGREYPVSSAKYSAIDEWKIHLWWAVCAEPQVS
jgi:hypothetical protein